MGPSVQTHVYLPSFLEAICDIWWWIGWNVKKGNEISIEMKEFFRNNTFWAQRNGLCYDVLEYNRIWVMKIIKYKIKYFEVLRFQLMLQYVMNKYYLNENFIEYSFSLRYLAAAILID